MKIAKANRLFCGYFPGTFSLVHYFFFLNNKVKHLNCEFPLIFWFVQNLYNFT